MFKLHCQFHFKCSVCESLVMEGRCQCGKISFQTPTSAPVWVHICHCLECRRQSGSAFGISAVFPVFTIPESEDLGCWTKHDPRGNDFHHYFCKVCGSRLLHTDGKTHCFVKAGCLDGLSRKMLDNAAHIFTKRAVVPIPDEAEQYEEVYPKGRKPW